jgi:hypothetical protein
MIGVEFADHGLEAGPAQDLLLERLQAVAQALGDDLARDGVGDLVAVDQDQSRGPVTGGD